MITATGNGRMGEMSGFSAMGVFVFSSSRLAAVVLASLDLGHAAKLLPCLQRTPLFQVVLVRYR